MAISKGMKKERLRIDDLPVPGTLIDGSSNTDKPHRSARIAKLNRAG
jgi:hypothetical protein